MTDWNKVFAVVGIALLAGGICLVSRIPVHNRENISEGTIWIWVPLDHSASDYKLLDVAVNLTVTNDKEGVIRFSFELLFWKARQYNFMVMQPMRVNRASVSMSSISGQLGILKKAVTEITPTGEFLTRTSYTSEGREEGSVKIYLDIAVSDPIAISEFGKRTAVLTFWAGIYPPVDALKENITYMPVWNSSIVLSIYYPSAWSLSFGDTFPQPSKPFTIRSFRGATWHLDFRRTLPNYGETLTIVWVVPSELQTRDWINFSGGLLAAIGAGIVSNSLREFLINRQRRPRTASPTELLRVISAPASSAR